MDVAAWIALGTAGPVVLLAVAAGIHDLCTPGTACPRGLCDACCLCLKCGPGWHHHVRGQRRRRPIRGPLPRGLDFLPAPPPTGSLGRPGDPPPDYDD